MSRLHADLLTRAFGKFGNEELDSDYVCDKVFFLTACFVAILLQSRVN